MRRAVIVASVAMFILSASLASAAVTHARTPTPTSTATPTVTPTRPPSTPSIAVTPVPVARFVGKVRALPVPTPWRVVAKIGNVTCGEVEATTVSICDPVPCGPIWDMYVFSSEARPGCGYEGAEILFEQVDSAGNVLGRAAEEGVWHPWDGIWGDSQVLDLTMLPIGAVSVGSTGTGDSRGNGTAVDGVLGLAVAGLAMLGIGVATWLRRRRGAF